MEILAALRILKKSIFYFPILAFIILLIAMMTINSVYVLLSNGEGKIIKKINRARIEGPDGKKLPSGLFVLLDNQVEIFISPPKLWKRVQIGDHLKKNKWSFIYCINHSNSSNAFFLIFISAIKIAFIMALGLLIISSIIFHKKKSF